MKITLLYFTALLALVSAEAAVSAESPEPICSLPGQTCNKIKRAAEAAAEAIAEPAARLTMGDRVCNRPGEWCTKAKRDALALAEAVAEFHESADPIPEDRKYP